MNDAIISKNPKILGKMHMECSSKVNLRAPWIKFDEKKGWWGTSQGFILADSRCYMTVVAETMQDIYGISARR